MKKMIVFSDDEYREIRDAIIEFKDDIWDIKGVADRATMFHNLNKLEGLLGIGKE